MKARPLTCSPFNVEQVEARFLIGRSNLPCLRQLQRRMNRALLLDRHYLQDLEENMCIASMQQGLTQFHCIDSFRLLLAQRDGNGPPLRVRELPVSLLRLYFAGQQHFHKLVEQIPRGSFHQLLALCEKDGHTDEVPTWYARDDKETPLVLQKQRARLVSYLSRLLDATFCSFERTLRLMNESLDWPDFGFREALQKDAFWVGQLFEPPTDWRENYLVWYASLWRCHVTLQIERLFKPWLCNEHRDWLLYRMQLFRDTHLDLQTVAVNRQCYSDSELSEPRLLALYWPACDRVCCAEELPDLAAFTLDNLKTGTYLKARNSLRDKLGHILFIKTMNNICKDRNFFDIVVRDGEQDELIYDLVKLIARCVLLGNLPHSRCNLCLLARIRCNASFWPEQADRIMSEQEVSETMPTYRNPYVMEQEKRDKKRRKEENKGTKPERIEQLVAALKRKQDRAAYDKTCFKMWILKCPYFVASLMKEFLFSVLEQGRCMDELLSLDHKWHEYKEIVRTANGQCRQEISRQVLFLAPAAPLDWSVIEHVDKPLQRDYDIKRGKIMEFHALALRVTKKVMKRDFMGIVEVKATGTEEEITNFHRQDATLVYHIPSDETMNIEEGQSLTQPQCVTLDELHFICWHMAQQLQRGTGILETRWFQAMGMSREGLAQLRNWIFRYYTYDIADDSLKDEIRGFRKRSMQDYLLMKTVFKLVSYYRRKERLFYMPVEFGVRQLNALRTRQLRVSEWESTPPLLGVAYQCHGCLKFANAVVQPLEFTVQSNYSELVRRKNQIYSDQYPRATHPQINGSTIHNLLLVHKDRRTRVIEYCKTQVARTGAGKNERKGAVKGDPDFDEEKHNEELEEEEQRRRRENISFLNVAFYNVQDGQAYCVRSRRQRVIVSRESTNQANVIMRCLRRPTRIESTRFTTRTVIPNQEPTTTQKKSVDDDDELGGDDTEEQLMEEEEVDFRPQYENNPLLFNPSIATLRREGRDYLTQWFGHGTGPVVATDPLPGEEGAKKPKSVENNKKKILRLINEPLGRVHNCQCPLHMVDMVGVVKNGHCLCVECGVMTLLTCHSMTPQGPVCMRHANVAFTQNHAVWQIDQQSTNFLQRRQAYDVPADLMATLSAAVTAPKMTKRRPHSLDVVSQAEAVFHWCHCCAQEHPAVRVTYQEAGFVLKKALCCLLCYRRLKPLMLKHGILQPRHLTPPTMKNDIGPFEWEKMRLKCEESESELKEEIKSES